MSIQDLLSSPESKTLEFKETMPTPQAISKTACAFANGGGGSVIIGVSDRDKKIIGIDELDIPDLEEKISNIIYTMVEPTPAFNTLVYNFNGKLLLKVDIFPGSLKPYQITSPGGLPSNVAIEDLGTGVSELRNKIIGKILNEAGLIEGYGTGVLRIRKYIQEKGLIQPEFRDNNGFFKAIFYNTKIGPWDNIHLTPFLGNRQISTLT